VELITKIDDNQTPDPGGWQARFNKNYPQPRRKISIARAAFVP
jgi:hypothetical protein